MNIRTKLGLMALFGLSMTSAQLQAAAAAVGAGTEHTLSFPERITAGAERIVGTFALGALNVTARATSAAYNLVGAGIDAAAQGGSRVLPTSIPAKGALMLAAYLTLTRNMPVTLRKRMPGVTSVPKWLAGMGLAWAAWQARNLLNALWTTKDNTDKLLVDTAELKDRTAKIQAVIDANELAAQTRHGLATENLRLAEVALKAAIAASEKELKSAIAASAAGVSEEVAKNRQAAETRHKEALDEQAKTFVEIIKAKEQAKKHQEDTLAAFRELDTRFTTLSREVAEARAQLTVQDTAQKATLATISATLATVQTEVSTGTTRLEGQLKGQAAALARLQTDVSGAVIAVDGLRGEVRANFDAAAARDKATREAAEQAARAAEEAQRTAELYGRENKEAMSALCAEQKAMEERLTKLISGAGSRFSTEEQTQLRIMFREADAPAQQSFLKELTAASDATVARIKEDLDTEREKDRKINTEQHRTLIERFDAAAALATQRHEELMSRGETDRMTIDTLTTQIATLRHEQTEAAARERRHQESMRMRRATLAQLRSMSWLLPMVTQLHKGTAAGVGSGKKLL